MLVAVFGTASRDAIAHPVAGLSAAASATFAHHAEVHGISVAFTLAALFDAIALVVVAVLLRDRDRKPGATAARGAGRGMAGATEEIRTPIPVPDLPEAE